MALILTEDEYSKLGKKQAVIPKELVDKVERNVSLYSKYKDTDGYKRASAIADNDYNKRSNKSNKTPDGGTIISFSDLKRISHDLNSTPNTKDNLKFILPGGHDMKTWANKELNRIRAANKQIKLAPKPPKVQKPDTGTEELKKSFKMGNSEVKLTDSKTPRKVIMTEQQILLLRRKI